MAITRDTKSAYMQRKSHAQRREQEWHSEIQCGKAWPLTNCSALILDFQHHLRFQKLNSYPISQLLCTLLRIDDKNLKMIHLSMYQCKIRVSFFLVHGVFYVLGNLKDLFLWILTQACAAAILGIVKDVLRTPPPYLF